MDGTTTQVTLAATGGSGEDGDCSRCHMPKARAYDGGYAEYMTVPEEYCYPIPEQFSDAQAAPLLCAGAVGYRALRLAGISDGEVLGLTGFGGSGHLVLQVSRHPDQNTAHVDG